MKAAAKLGRRRFLRLEAKPNICVLQDVRFTPSEMQDVLAVVGRDLFTAELRETLGQFEQAKNFGSLIAPKLRAPIEVARVVRSKDFGGDLLLRELQHRALKVLEMAEALSPKYHVVVANPPYMGGKGMNGQLGDFAKDQFPDSKTDLYSIFMERINLLIQKRGFAGFMTPFTWLSLKSFEVMRSKILSNNRIVCLVQPEYHSFFESAYVPVCAFVLEKKEANSRRGVYIDLKEFYGSDVQGPKALEGINNPSCNWRVAIDQEEFSRIPGKPIAFSISERTRISFRSDVLISDIAEPRQGLATANNEKYLRAWWEVAKNKIALPWRGADLHSSDRWFPYQKGGSFRKWFGNHELVIDWQHNGRSLRADPKAVIRNPSYYFKEGMTWTSLTVSSFNGRYCPEGFVFDSKGPVLFPRPGYPLKKIMAFLNSKVSAQFLSVLAPTMDFSQGPVGNVPVRPIVSDETSRDRERISKLISIARSDWDSFETSWDFATPLLLADPHKSTSAQASYESVLGQWKNMVEEMRRLEGENNRIFIDGYDLQDELDAEVPLEEITLTCNPAYRYGGNAGTVELDGRLLADTMAEFLHYAVGCMFGRYSIDAPGLILANQGEGLADYLARVPNPRFDVDADNVIPVLEGDWFADDITERFRKFLRVTFGEEKFQENLAFIEEALGKDIRKWFTKDFFDYHVRRYKKRPIYWMFSSPKGTFNALIYMHRYRPDTVSVVLNDYLRELISKLQAERARLEKLADDGSVSQAQRTRALKEIGTVVKQIDELSAWERDVIFPLAQTKIEIDLDDGVKANYPKFGAALRPIKGLDAKEDE